MPTGGAIVHIIYEILSQKNSLDKCFTAQEIVEKFDPNDPIQNNIIEKFCKHSSLKTLQDKEELNKWMNKHTSQKEVLWFEHCNERGKFKFKKECLDRIKKEREGMMS